VTTSSTVENGGHPNGGHPNGGHPKEHPKLADGIELIGEYEGSGFKEPPSLARRADGQVIQLTPLLYSVAEKADGEKHLSQIADEVGTEIGRTVTADNVDTLVDKKLRPLGSSPRPTGPSPRSRSSTRCWR
jgi:putative peptide zinc metalloprotease protein